MYKLFMLRKLLALCLGTLAYYVVGKLLEYILIRVWTKN